MPKTNTNSIFHCNAFRPPPSPFLNFKQKWMITDIQAGDRGGQTLPLSLALWAPVFPSRRMGRRTLQLLMRRL